jgi:pentatricopeptide repeat domain-containing protein 1
MKACATGKRWREAVSLLNAMLAQGLRPDGVSYRTVMNACIEGGEWQHALKILQRMRDDGLQWDLTTYNVAIKVGTP